MRVYLFGLILFLICCKATDKLSKVNSALDAEHARQIIEYRELREGELKKPMGWLSVSGLFWLKEGMNSFGADQENDFIFPHTETPTIGAYQKSDRDIIFGKIEGVDVTHKGEDYPGGFVELSGPRTVLNHGPLYWYIIQRGQKYGIRLIDTLADNRTHFDGIPVFDTDRSYKLDAKVIKSSGADSVAITNVLGQVDPYPVAAYLEFTFNGVEHRLTALDEGGNYYFVIFSDETTGAQTYGGGRFIYPAKPCDTCDQVTVLDFNKAQNPPCAYSDFATCPLPPEENKLNFAILAGEKFVGDH